MAWTIVALVLLNIVAVAVISEDEGSRVKVVLGLAAISASYVLEYMHLTNSIYT